MKFTTLSLVLTMSAILSSVSTTCNAQEASPAVASLPPVSLAGTEDHLRIEYNGGQSKNSYYSTAGDEPAQLIQSDDGSQTNDIVRRFIIPEHSKGQKRTIRLIKRIGPRRLAGERRAILDNIVEDIVPLKPGSDDELVQGVVN
ncbi:hypothetical protein BGX27_005319 [Mortierella sp. AM989]|nr:hypothetical protein BGX27_005319 [Mortierella sp. AM989]